MALATGRLGGIDDPLRWPWHWHRLAHNIRRVQNVYEQVALDDDPESATPPRWVFWDAKAANEWFDNRREEQRTRRKEKS